jgi:hypothetical protein
MAAPATALPCLPRRGRIAALLALASVLVLVPAAPAPSARTIGAVARADTVTLQLIVTGKDGRVFVSGRADCDITQTRDNGESCLYQVEQGEQLTLEATSAADFVGWSLFECPGKDPCTVQMNSDRTVVATFTPTSLTIAMGGGFQDANGGPIDGSITSSDGTIDCRASGGTCGGDFDAFADVTLTATPESAFETWSGACQEAGTSPTCKLLLSGDDVVGAKFKDADADPEISPPRQTAQLEVVVSPAGTGTVTSTRSRVDEAIDCSPTCKAKFEQGENPTLTAEPASRFVGWKGGKPYCNTSATCSYPAFGVTSIEAVFAPPPPPVFKAAIATVSVATSGKSRTLAVAVVVDRPSKATLRLLRKTTGLASRSYTLRKGKTLLRLVVPPTVKPGWYAVTIKFVSLSGQVLVRSRPLHLKN